MLILKYIGLKTEIVTNPNLRRDSIRASVKKEQLLQTQNTSYVNVLKTITAAVNWYLNMNQQ